jgi:hypothetical protein
MEKEIGDEMRVRFFGQTRQRARLATETDLSIDMPNRFEHDLR